MTVKPVPDGYAALTPYVAVKGAGAFVEFLKRAFDATEWHAVKLPDGTLRHAEVRVFGSPLMLRDATPEWPESPGTFYLYVADCDAVYRRALDAGATSVRKPVSQWYGDRCGCVKDVFGNQWIVCTHVEDLSPETAARRAKEQGL